ncbi:glycine betaine ABC transporter substrate-binding protein [Candidatus Poriferisodalis sp.]|uniref:glycine betaine ABC transporter substrate-binding protein n=1 Tax=Candidatus Poriferisodalis sp. TaxID=3101277 RepID=UPI003B014875
MTSNCQTRRATVRPVLVVAAFALGLAATGCSRSEVPAVGHPAATTETAVTEPTAAVSVDGVGDAVTGGGQAPASVPLRPGKGVEVTAGMQSEGWSRFRAEVYRQLLSELGYEVSVPWEAGPNVAYLWMAAGDLDYWTDGLLPSHEAWLDGDSFDGSRVGDHVSVVGQQMSLGNVLGWLISKTFADEHGVFTMDELNRDPAALAAFDAADAVPGNGRADVFSLGGISDISESQAAFSGWDNITFVKIGEEEMIERAASAVNAGAPFVMFVGTPAAVGETRTLSTSTRVVVWEPPRPWARPWSRESTCTGWASKSFWMTRTRWGIPKEICSPS